MLAARTSSSLHDIDDLPLLAQLSHCGSAQVAVLGLGAVDEGGAGAQGLPVPPGAGAGTGHQGGLGVGGQPAGGPHRLSKCPTHHQQHLLKTKHILMHIAMVLLWLLRKN